jgi:hypothetical protein
MKILFTGMGSHHCKRPDNTSFFTLLSDFLSEYAEVVWASPSMSWKKEDLEKYDQIIFGFLPPTSLSANKIYGALNVLGLMFDSPKLKLVVDSPQIWQYKNSLSAVIKNPSILFSNFYSKREGYEAATRNTSIVDRACSHMRVSEWPTILYPGLPWNSNEKISNLLGFGSAETTVGISLDPLHIEPEPARIGRKDYWALENQKSTWLESLNKSLTFPLEPTKIGRKTDDSYALEIIRDGMGLLLPPQERNSTTWWNYRMIQAMNTSTPISTYWPDTVGYSPSWGMLAYQIEDMSPSQRQILASTQRNFYLESLPSREETKKELKDLLLNSTKERI